MSKFMSNSAKTAKGKKKWSTRNNRNISTKNTSTRNTSTDNTSDLCIAVETLCTETSPHYVGIWQPCEPGPFLKTVFFMKGSSQSALSHSLVTG